MAKRKKRHDHRRRKPAYRWDGVDLVYIYDPERRRFQTVEGEWVLRLDDAHLFYLQRGESLRPEEGGVFLSEMKAVQMVALGDQANFARYAKDPAPPPDVACPECGGTSLAAAFASADLHCDDCGVVSIDKAMGSHSRADHNQLH